MPVDALDILNLLPCEGRALIFFAIFLNSHGMNKFFWWLLAVPRAWYPQFLFFRHRREGILWNLLNRTRFSMTSRSQVFIAKANKPARYSSALNNKRDARNQVHSIKESKDCPSHDWIWVISLSRFLYVYVYVFFTMPCVDYRVRVARW